jgi:C1A family cysteine protease
VIQQCTKMVVVAFCFIAGSEVCVSRAISQSLPHAAHNPHGYSTFTGEESQLASANRRPVCVDLRPQFQRTGLVVRPQGKRGTCSVFTVTRAIEFALSDRESSGSRLSVEFLNWASNEAIGQQQDGGFFSDLWKGFQQYGICDEQEMPYAREFDAKRKPSENALRQAQQRRPRKLQLHWIKPWNPNCGLNDTQLHAVKMTLQRGFPVCGGFLWPKRVIWSDGVLKMAARPDVRDGHSVLLVGYCDEESQPGGGYFLIQNTSRGPRCGKMSYAYAQAYMNDAAWIGPKQVAAEAMAN